MSLRIARPQDMEFLAADLADIFDQVTGMPKIMLDREIRILVSPQCQNIFNAVLPQIF